MNLDWLNTNAAAVQAAASVVAAIVTSLLLFVTWKYVRLTSELAEAAARQVDFLAREREARRARVLNSIRRLRRHLDTLPGEQKHAEQIRQATLWEANEPQQLAGAASDISFEAGKVASAVVPPLVYLRDRAREVKETPIQRGVDWNRFDWPAWESNSEAARRELKALWEAVVAERESPSID